MKKTKNLLIIDDEVKILELFKLHFEDTEFNITTLDKGSDFEQQFVSLCPDAIITDIFLEPNYNGIEIAKLARSVIPKIPIFIISSYQPEDFKGNELEDIHNLNVINFTSKPFHFDEYIKLIQDTLC